MSEALKISAQSLNGLAVAVLTTAGAAFIGKHVSADILILAGLLRLATHTLAVRLVKD